MQSGEVLPCEAGGVLGTRADVRSKVCPSPGLRNTSLKPDRHGVETEHLAERHLLTSLRGDGLSKELTNLTGVEVVDETPDTRLAPTSELLVKVDKLTNCAEGVVVGALRSSCLTKHVA